MPSQFFVGTLQSSTRRVGASQRLLQLDHAGIDGASMLALRGQLRGDLFVRRGDLREASACFLQPLTTVARFFGISSAPLTFAFELRAQFGDQRVRSPEELGACGPMLAFLLLKLEVGSPKLIGIGSRRIQIIVKLTDRLQRVGHLARRACPLRGEQADALLVWRRQSCLRFLGRQDCLPYTKLCRQDCLPYMEIGRQGCLPHTREFSVADFLGIFGGMER